MTKNILWDFDGVILDSMPIRDSGFKIVLKEKNYSDIQIEKLLEYHSYNGGLSRFKKFKYFYEDILKSNNLKEINLLVDRFSEVMKTTLCNRNLLFEDTYDFISKNYKNYNMHIVSGSYGMELKYICHKLNLSKFFITINGSNVDINQDKSFKINEIIKTFNYNKQETVLIGDSINDYQASLQNKIKFYGYNPSKSLLKFKNEIKIINNYNIFKNE